MKLPEGTKLALAWLCGVKMANRICLRSVEQEEDTSFREEDGETEADDPEFYGKFLEYLERGNAWKIRRN